IVSGSYDSTARVWDVATQTTLVTYPGHNDPVERAAWSPDGQYIASASLDTTVQVWKAANGERVCIYQGHNKSVWAIAWSPDGKRIASGGDISPVVQEDGTISRAEEQALHVWDAATGKDVLAFGQHFHRIYSLCWSPDGKYLAFSSIHHKVDVYDAATG